MSWADEIIAEQDARAAKLAELTMRAAGFPVRLESRHGWVLLVSRCPSEPGRWRVTRFDGSEPVGHTTRDTLAEAISAAVTEYGGNVDGAEVIR